MQQIPEPDDLPPRSRFLHLARPSLKEYPQVDCPLVISMLLTRSIHLLYPVGIVVINLPLHYVVYPGSIYLFIVRRGRNFHDGCQRAKDRGSVP